MINLEERKLNLEELFSKRNVHAAYLFGSQARSESGPLSDIDIAVLIDSKVPKDNYFDIKINLISELMSLFETNKIDVVILNEAPPLLKYNIISSGKIIYNIGADDRRMDFEIKSIIEYFDTQEIRDVYDSYFIEEILKSK